MANRYWVGGTGTWDATTTHWSATTGGAGGATAPTTADAAIFDNSSSSGAFTVTRTATTGVQGLQMMMSGGTPPVMTFAGSSAIPIGIQQWRVGASVIWTNTGTVTISGVGIGSFQVLTTITSPVVYACTSGSVLGADLTTTSSFTILSGYLYSNWVTCSSATISSGVTTLYGTPGFIITGNNGTVFSCNATSTTAIQVSLTYAGSVGTRIISLLSFNGNLDSTGSDIISFATGSNATGSINLSGFSGTLANTAWSCGSLTLSSTMTVTSGTNTVTASGAINTLGKVITFPLSLKSGTSLLGALTVDSTHTLTISDDGSSVTSFAGFPISAGKIVFALPTGNPNLFISDLTLTGSGTILDSSALIGMGVNLTIAYINLSDTSTTARTFIGAGFIYGNLSFTGSNICTTTFTGANYFGTMSSTKTTAFTLVFQNSVETIIYDWLLYGSLGKVITVKSDLAGTPATLTISSNGYIGATTAFTAYDYLSFQDITGNPVLTWYVGTVSPGHTVNVSGNTNLIFQSTPAIAEPLRAGNHMMTGCGV